MNKPTTLPRSSPVQCEYAQSCPTLSTPKDCSTQAPRSCDFPGKNTGVGYHFHLQDLCDPGRRPYSRSAASAGRFFTPSATWEALFLCFSLLDWKQKLWTCVRQEETLKRESLNTQPFRVDFHLSEFQQDELASLPSRKLFFFFFFCFTESAIIWFKINISFQKGSK